MCWWAMTGWNWWHENGRAMSGFGEAHWVSIVALAGWLVLVLGAYRSHRVDTGKTIRMALMWGAIFAAVAFVFSLVS